MWKFVLFTLVAGASVAVAQPAQDSTSGSDAPPPAPPTPHHSTPPNATTSYVTPETISVQAEALAVPVTGASVSVVTRQQIDALPGGDLQPLEHVIATQPGFVTDTFGFGLHARAADGGLSYVIDGIPLLTPPLTQWASTESFIPTKLVETLDIITGGFPAEYGYGLGGVVDITTRHAALPPSTNAQISYGSYNTTRASVDHTQTIGNLNLSVAANFESTDRGLDPPDSGTVLHDHMTAGGAFALLDYEATARDRIELLSFFDQSMYQIPIDPDILPLSQLPPGTMRSPDSYGNAPPPFVPYDANPTDTERNVFAAVSYRHLFDHSELQIAPFFRESYGDLLCDPDRSLGATADPGSTCSDVRRNVFHEGLSGNYTLQTGAHQVVKMGILADNATSRVSYSSYTRDDANPDGGPDSSDTLAGEDRTNTLLAGAYVQDALSYGRWKVLPGARLDVQSVHFIEGDEPSETLVGPSGRLGASYAATDRVLLHAYAGYLWQPPNSVDAAAAARVLVPALAGQTLPVDLKAEKDWTAEIGIADRLARWLTLGLNVWGRLATDQIDRQLVGNTNLMVSYNFAKGRAAGAELSGTLNLTAYFDAFANGGWQLGQGQGIDSERYLFSAAELADTSWQILDHVQTWTANVGFDLHDKPATTHFSGIVKVGSGLRTGDTNQYTLPWHATLDLTLRRRFDFGTFRPEIAIDVYNLFNDIYAYRLATGNDGSAWALPRTVFVRLSLPLPW